MEAGWLAAAAIIPFFFNASSLQTFEPEKMFVLRALVLLSGAAWLLRRIAGARQGIGPQIHLLLRKPLVPPVLALAVVYLLSSIFSVAPVLSWWGAYYEAQGTIAFLCYAILFLIVLAELRSPAQLRRLQYVIILTSIPISAYAILQRFGGDPFPWENTFVGGRTGGNMGNPIFLGGYLLMIIPLTICRIIDGFKSVRGVPDRRPALVLVGSCGAALLLQGLALLYTESRGPLLGLAGAAYLCLSIFLVRNKSPRQGGVGASAAAAGLGLVVPLLAIAVIYASVRFSPRYVFACLAVTAAIVAVSYWFIWKTCWGRSWLWLTFLVQPLALITLIAFNPGNPFSASQAQSASFGRLIQFSDPSVKLREAYWEAGARFLRAGPQQVLPDGTRDSHYFLRAVLGYGPECTWLISNTYATPSLVRFRFQESENRLHNEIFDDLITTGYAGTMLYLWIVAGAFYYSLRYLGFAFERRGKITFAVLSCAGIFAGFLIPWMAGAPQFIGIGVEVGLLAGIFGFVGWSGFRNMEAGSASSPQQLFVLGILGALTAHLIEVAVGITVAPTRLYFYLYLALLAVCCSGNLAVREEPAKRAKTKTSHPETSPWIPFAAIAAFVVFVQTWCFTFSSGNEKSAPALFVQCWFGSFSGEKARIPTALLLLLLTISAGAALMYAEIASAPIFRPSRKSMIRFAAFLSAAWLIAGLISALFWNGLENANPIEYSQHSEARMTVFVLGLVFLVIAAALILRTGEGLRPRGSGVRKAEVLVGILLSVITGLGIWELTLRPAWADIAVLNARTYESVGDAASAVQLYERAAQMSPRVVQYYFYLGLAQLRAAGSDPAKLEQARLSFQRARDLNPLDPVVYRTLGTFHTYVGENSPDLKIRTAEITEAIKYFDKAHLLTPNYPNAYNEKGRCLSLLGDYAAAEKIFQKSIQLNPDYWRTYKYLGEMQYRQKNFAGALQSFTTAAQINPEDIDPAKNIGVLLALLGRTSEAIGTTLEALKRAPNDSALLANLSSWYFAVGDYNSGINFAKRAYDSTPTAGKGSFNQFVENLKNKKWQ